MRKPKVAVSIHKQVAVLAGSIALMTGQIASGQTSADRYANITATQINSSNVTELQRRGPDAIGGLGDWFFSNGIVCAVISDVDHEGEFSTKGGSLVDLGFCGRDDDYFAFTHDLLNGSRSRPLNAESVSIEPFNNTASIVVRSQGDGAKLTTRYFFDRSNSTALQVSKVYQRIDGEPVNFVSPLNFNLRSLEPFVFNSRDPKTSNGFQNQDFVERGASAIELAARNADTIILPAPRSAVAPIAYGWQLKQAQRVTEESRVDLPFFVLADPQSTAMMVLSDTFYLGDGDQLGWPQLPQIPLLELDSGSTIETREIIYLGKRGDVASITDQLLPHSHRVTGQIDEANSSLHVSHANGGPLTQLTPQPNGTFEFQAPAGAYSLEALAHGGRRSELTFEVKDNASNILKEITLPAAAKLRLPQGDAMRLVFVGIDGTPPPDFAGELSQASTAFDDHIERKGPISTIFMAGIDSDRREIDIAPGHYLIYATKGPEFSLEKTTLKLAAGQQTALQIKTPTRVINTPGYIASDLHVHSGLSFDNVFAETERVRTFVAEHGEVLVSSEHDLPTDFAPYIQAMGVTNKIVSIPAAEVTSILPTKSNPFTGGHANFFPYEPRHHHYRKGMVNHEGKRLRDTIHSIKQFQPDVLVQLNHPRHDAQLAGQTLPSDWRDIVDNGNYLDHMGSAGHPYNPHKTLHTHPNSVLTEIHPDTGLRDLDFDLIEVINPGGVKNQERIATVRQDWLSFVKQGERIVAVANSDSHNAHEQVAVPRTMVAMDDDRIAAFKREEFLHNLKAGDAYGTTGPMLQVSMLNSPENTFMGGTYKGMRGTLIVHIKKASWIPLERLEIQINGETIDTHTLVDKPQQTVQIPLQFEQDSFVTVEVFGQAGNDYSAVYPGLDPYAFSNPIYVDFDQDGQWKAPGL